MRASLLLVLLSCVTLGSACESETGVLVRTSASESLSSEIHSLRFYVGKNEIDAALYYADRDPLDDVELEGRDIADEPYRLLLTPRGNATDDDAFVVAVLALGSDGLPIGMGRLPAPISFQAGKVLQWDLDIAAMAGDVSVTDTGCLQYLDEGLGGYVHIGVDDDADCDGFTADGGDCNDLNPAQSPAKSEDCANGVDDNCNGLVDDDDTADSDGDGYASCGGDGEADCNDNDANIHPGKAEICDGLDNDCNDLCDDGFDDDDDKVSICGTVLSDGLCVAEATPDCDDQDPARYPGKAEICDGIDNDCSGRCDDDAALDPDGDRYTECGSVIGECGVESFLVDCEPNNSDVHPGEAELCDGIDSDCDGADVSSSPCFVIDPEDQACREGVRECTDGMLGTECTLEADSTALPTDFCSVYQGCESNAAIADPLECILDAGNQQPVDELCEVAMVGGETCSGNRVRVLPEGNIDGQNLCSYAIIGGQIQQGYSLTLVADGVAGQVVTGCQADLVVEGLPGAGDSTVSINFADDVAGTTQVIHLRLKAHRLASCSGPGLSCATWDLVPE